MNKSKNKDLELIPSFGTGTTVSERLLKTLCDRSFLTLWSYAGIYRDQGQSKQGADGKEVCDVLVVFEDHIIIFSDKDCVFPNAGNPMLDWDRWYKRAIEKSADQIWGAERWIRKFPNRLFLDCACTIPFPLILPDVNSAHFHRILVSHGAAQRCREFFGGESSGSLMIQPSIIGKQHYSNSSEEWFPFAVGQVDPSKGFIHVLDDVTLDILLDSLDTITDFVLYLTKKEQFASSGRLGGAGGEEDLLAFYLSRLNKQVEHDFVIEEDDNEDGVNRAIAYIGAGHWADFWVNPQRLAKVEADKVSYFWDSLLETFIGHAVGNSLYYSSHSSLSELEKIYRLMARESRVRRRLLSESVRDIWHKTPPNMKGTRVVEPSFDGEPYYIFLMLPNNGIPDKQYREDRLNLLLIYLHVMKCVYPGAKDIIGIATESGFGVEKSWDNAFLDARSWTDEEQKEAVQLRQELGLFKNVEWFQGIMQEYPDVKAVLRKRESPRKAKGVGFGKSKGKQKSR